MPIQIRRGAKVDLVNGADGEPLLVEDPGSEEVHIGTPQGNIQLATSQIQLLDGTGGPPPVLLDRVRAAVFYSGADAPVSFDLIDGTLLPINWSASIQKQTSPSGITLIPFGPDLINGVNAPFPIAAIKEIITVILIAPSTWHVI